jgi:hypothetical protein
MVEDERGTFVWGVFQGLSVHGVGGRVIEKRVFSPSCGRSTHSK